MPRTKYVRIINRTSKKVKLMRRRSKGKSERQRIKEALKSQTRY